MKKTEFSDYISSNLGVTLRAWADECRQSGIHAWEKSMAMVVAADMAQQLKISPIRFGSNVGINIERILANTKLKPSLTRPVETLLRLSGKAKNSFHCDLCIFSKSRSSDLDLGNVSLIFEMKSLLNYEKTNLSIRYVIADILIVMAYSRCMPEFSEAKAVFLNESCIPKSQWNKDVVMTKINKRFAGLAVEHPELGEYLLQWQDFFVWA